MTTPRDRPLYRNLVFYTGALFACVALIAFGLLLDQAPLPNDVPLVLRFSWLPQLGLFFSFRLDGLSLLFCTLITCIGSLIFLYGGVYFSRAEGGLKPIVALFVFFIAMLGLVLAESLLVMFVFWELTSLTSFLLIGTTHDDPEAWRAARQALVVTSAGGLCLLAAALWLWQGIGALGWTELYGATANGYEIPLGVVVLVLLAAATKSAQVPFHSWLPRAMAAPTPVSAYLHSATMVKAGVYLIARFGRMIEYSPTWTFSLLVLGCLTALLGALLAVFARDLKKMLAYTTVSALGTLVVLLGMGTDQAIRAALVYLVAHSFYKAALFMVIGVIDHTTHTRDLTKLGGLAYERPLLALIAIPSGLSMAGIPPFVGFLAKELLYEVKFAGTWIFPALGAVAFSTSVLTFAAAMLITYYPFFGNRPDGLRIFQVSAWLLIGPLFLALGSMLAGLFPELLGQELLSPAVQALTPGASEIHLTLWHGVNPILLMSIATVLLGVALGRFRIRYLHSTPAPRGVQLLSDEGSLFDEVYHALLTTAQRFGDAMQRGSLQWYVRITALVVVLSSVTYLEMDATLVRVAFASLRTPSAFDLALTIVLVIPAMAALTLVRPAEVLLVLGATGVGMVAVFLAYGAPDVALTQIVVETLIVVVFAFVARHFHRPVGHPPRARVDITSLAIALSTALVITFALVVATAREPSPEVREFYASAATREGFGRNVVNVILVDFRALDTLGEISVLALVAITLAALVARRSTWTRE